MSDRAALSAIGVLSLLWGWLLLPKGRMEDQRTPRLDLPGSVLLGAFLVCLLVPLTFGEEWGWLSARSLLLLTAAAAALIAFVMILVFSVAPLSISASTQE